MRSFQAVTPPQPGPYFCPTCKISIPASAVRVIHTGHTGETLHAHRCWSNLHGAEVLLDHVVVAAPLLGGAW